MSGDARQVKRLGSANLEAFFYSLQENPSWRWTGRVTVASEQTIESRGPLCSVGSYCDLIDVEGRRHPGEVIGFRGTRVLTMPLGSTHGIVYGDEVQAEENPPTICVGEQMRGGVFDATGEPLDGSRRPRVREVWRLNGELPNPMTREPIREPLQTGIRALDGLLTVGRGQRIGIFGGSGVGKTTLIGMMTRNTAADVTIVGLVGERGREVREFLDEALGEDGRSQSIVVVSTSDQTPLLKMRAALAATTIAEFHAAQGKHVLLILDSLTRYAMAAREIGLSAGEPPASKGYTPSVYTRLARLVERAGNFQRGSITAFYTVLMEGDDQQDPVVDAVRSYLDGHIVLSREMAQGGHYPPIDVLDSLSRLMPAVTTRHHRTRATLVRSMLSTYRENEDLLKVGAYKHGQDAFLDRAVGALEQIKRFCQQDASERVSLTDSILALEQLDL